MLSRRCDWDERGAMSWPRFCRLCRTKPCWDLGWRRDGGSGPATRHLQALELLQAPSSVVDAVLEHERCWLLR